MARKIRAIFSLSIWILMSSSLLFGFSISIVKYLCHLVNIPRPRACLNIVSINALRSFFQEHELFLQFSLMVHELFLDFFVKQCVSYLVYKVLFVTIDSNEFRYTDMDAFYKLAICLNSLRINQGCCKNALLHMSNDIF